MTLVTRSVPISTHRRCLQPVYGSKKATPWLSRSLKTQSAPSGLPGPRRIPSSISIIDHFLPRKKFGTSIFSTPALLLFRLFYQALPFDHQVVLPVVTSALEPSSIGETTTLHAPGQLNSSNSSTTPTTTPSATTSPPESLASRISTKTFHSILLSPTTSPIPPSSTITSITWLKALASPLSHEFIQFILISPCQQHRYRLIAERKDDGDWIWLTALSSPSSSSISRIAWSRVIDDQHGLPLPLLSLSWNHLPSAKRPNAVEFAGMLKDVTDRCPKYRIMREHCWWFAEAVFEDVLDRLRHGESESESRFGNSEEERERAPVVKLKQWPWASYRYSYVVRGKKVWRRDNIVRDAEKFGQEMDWGGELRW